MFKKIFGKDDKDGQKAKPPVKGALSARGLEVVDDDPETVWGMWDSAMADLASRDANLPSTASKVPEASGFPNDDSEYHTVPMSYDEKPTSQRVADALAVVEAHHQRIASTIRSLWGDKECANYVNKLIMSGGDGMGHARVGFNQEAVTAMMALSDLHEELFGPPEMVQFGFDDRKR